MSTFSVCRTFLRAKPYLDSRHLRQSVLGKAAASRTRQLRKRWAGRRRCVGPPSLAQVRCGRWPAVPRCGGRRGQCPGRGRFARSMAGRARTARGEPRRPADPGRRACCRRTEAWPAGCAAGGCALYLGVCAAVGTPVSVRQQARAVVPRPAILRRPPASSPRRSSTASAFWRRPLRARDAAYGSSSTQPADAESPLEPTWRWRTSPTSTDCEPRPCRGRCGNC